MTPRETKTGKTVRVLASECTACRAWHACPRPRSGDRMVRRPELVRRPGPETKRSGPPTLQLFVQLTAFWAHAHNVLLQPTHVPGRNNNWADDLSRGRLARFSHRPDSRVRFNPAGLALSGSGIHLANSRGCALRTPITHILAFPSQASNALHGWRCAFSTRPFSPWRGHTSCKHWLPRHELNGVVGEVDLPATPNEAVRNCAFFHEIGSAIAQKNSTTKANISEALSRTSALSRSSTKRKALWGFQANSPCNGGVEMRCHQNAEKRPPKWHTL